MITFFLQLVIPIALMFYRFERRKYFVLRVVGFGALFFGLSALYFDPQAIPFPSSAVGFFCYYLVGYVFAFLYAMLCFDMPIMNIVFFCFAAFLVQNLAHHIFEFIVRCMGVPVGGEYDAVEYLLLLAAVYVVIYAVYFFLFIRRLRPEELMQLPRLSTFAIVGAFLIVMIILGVFVRHIRSEILVGIVAIGYEVYSVILDLFIIALQYGTFRNSRLLKSNEELEGRLQREAHYYDMAKSNMELINIKCHDLKHQIAALENIRDSDERRSSIDELKRAVMIYDDIAKTGNDALDCLFTEKSMYCRNNDITFTYMADGKSLSFVRYSDIYALFGNALDNAFESVMKCEDKEKRIVGLKLFERGEQIYIHIENYCDRPPKMSDGLPVTTKQGEGHGFGTKSIRYIVKKYGGNLTLGYHGNMFTLDILIPIAQEPKEKTDVNENE